MIHDLLIKTSSHTVGEHVKYALRSMENDLPIAHDEHLTCDPSEVEHRLSDAYSAIAPAEFGTARTFVEAGDRA